MSQGVVTPVSTGKVTITATATDGSGVRGSIEITVEPVETPGGGTVTTPGTGTGTGNEGQYGTGEGNRNQTGETTPTTQATNNAIVVSR